MNKDTTNKLAKFLTINNHKLVVSGFQLIASEASAGGEAVCACGEKLLQI